MSALLIKAHCNNLKGDESFDRKMQVCAEVADHISENTVTQIRKSAGRAKKESNGPCTNGAESQAYLFPKQFKLACGAQSSSQ